MKVQTLLIIIGVVIVAVVVVFGYRQWEESRQIRSIEERRQQEEERRRQQQEEAERLKRQQEEEEKRRQQQEEAERLRRQQEEERRRRQQEEDERLRRQREAERLRQQQEEAERLRRQQEEERRRRQQEEAERLRRQQEEERRRQQQEEDERQRREREERLREMRSKPYVVDWFNDYSSFSEFGNTSDEGAAIDREIKDQLKGHAANMIQVVRQDSFSIGSQLSQLTLSDLKPVEAEVAFIGAIRKNENNQYVIEFRVYSKAGKYLSEIRDTETKDRAEIARQYGHLILSNFPFSGIITNQTDATLQIALQAGAYISKDAYIIKEMITDRLWQVVGRESEFQLTQLSFDISGQLTAVMIPPQSGIQPYTTIVSVVKIKPQFSEKLIVRIYDKDNNKLDNFQVYVSPEKGGQEEYAGLLTTGEIDLTRFTRSGKTIYGTVKTGQDKTVVGTFETSASEGPQHNVTLHIKSSDYK